MDIPTTYNVVTLEFSKCLSQTLSNIYKWFMESVKWFSPSRCTGIEKPEHLFLRFTQPLSQLVIGWHYVYCLLKLKSVHFFQMRKGHLHHILRVRGIFRNVIHLNWAILTYLQSFKNIEIPNEAQEKYNNVGGENNWWHCLPKHLKSCDLWRDLSKYFTLTYPSQYTPSKQMKGIISMHYRSILLVHQ